jgi:molybdopterin-guanine dinucleotide biosynthesis protein A
MDAIFVRDPLEDEGPLAALAGALPNASHPLVLVLGGDMPRVSSAVLQLLAGALAGAPSAQMAVLRDGDVLRPLPCGLRRGALDTVGALVDGGERRLRALLTALPLAAVPEETWRAADVEGRSLQDVDRPEQMP